MGFSYSDSIYRKVEYDTYNCFCDYGLRTYLKENGIEFHRLYENGHAKFVFYMSEEELSNLIDYIDSTANENILAAEDLYKKRDFFLKYFDSVEITENCWLEITIHQGLPKIKIYNDPDIHATWGEVLSTFSAQANKYTLKFLRSSLSEFYLMSAKPDDEIMEMALSIHQNIRICEANIKIELSNERGGNPQC